MKAPALVVLALGALALAPIAPQESTADRLVERKFAAGGAVHLDLAAGDYKITGTDAETIRVRWETRDADASRVHTNVAVNGRSARISTRGPKRDFHVYIDLPTRSDLDLYLSAGDLTVRGVEGSKRLSMWAGDVTIETGDAQLYGRVHASVRFGELQSPTFGAHKGGILRSFNWRGAGRYTIDARLFAGDLKLVR
jgi:phage baseplate assembly protein gpV